jgi:hypothetical protein
MFSLYIFPDEKTRTAVALMSLAFEPMIYLSLVAAGAVLGERSQPVEESQLIAEAALWSLNCRTNFL